MRMLGRLQLPSYLASRHSTFNTLYASNIIKKINSLVRGTWILSHEDRMLGLLFFLKKCYSELENLQKLAHAEFGGSRIIRTSSSLCDTPKEKGSE